MNSSRRTADTNFRRISIHETLRVIGGSCRPPADRDEIEQSPYLGGYLTSPALSNRCLTYSRLLREMDCYGNTFLRRLAVGIAWRRITADSIGRCRIRGPLIRLRAHFGRRKRWLNFLRCLLLIRGLSLDSRLSRWRRLNRAISTTVCFMGWKGI